MILSAEAIDLLADAIAQRVLVALVPTTAWVSAAAVARHLGVDVAYVYEHSEKLGARRLGDGPKARMRFRLDLVEQALRIAGGESVAPPPRLATPTRTPRCVRSPGSAAELLPIRGSAL